VVFSKTKGRENIGKRSGVIEKRICSFDVDILPKLTMKYRGKGTKPFE
jgi:hypothetical protein